MLLLLLLLSLSLTYKDDVEKSESRGFFGCFFVRRLRRVRPSDSRVDRQTASGVVDEQLGMTDEDHVVDLQLELAAAKFLLHGQQVAEHSVADSDESPVRAEIN